MMECLSGVPHGPIGSFHPAVYLFTSIEDANFVYKREEDESLFVSISVAKIKNKLAVSSIERFAFKKNLEASRPPSARTTHH